MNLTNIECGAAIIELNSSDAIELALACYEASEMDTVIAGDHYHVWGAFFEAVAAATQATETAGRDKSLARVRKEAAQFALTPVSKWPQSLAWYLREQGEDGGKGADGEE